MCTIIICIMSGPAHLHGLVHIPHILRFYVGVLLARPHKLWERGKQPLDPYSAHVHELPRDQSCKQCHQNSDLLTVW